MEKYQKYFTLATLILCLFTFLKTCGTSSELKRMEKNIEGLNKKVHQIDSTSIKQEQMVKIIKETPNWRTLEIEELSDKNKVPVNELKIKNESHDKLYRWLNGEKVRNIQKAIALCRDLELDNERRSVKLIKKFNLNVDIDLYIKKANAYIQFYNYLMVSRKWCKPNNSPYKNRRLLRVMPAKFNMDYKKLSKKVLRIFIEENI